jgi:hypothetical protein
MSSLNHFGFFLTFSTLKFQINEYTPTPRIMRILVSRINCVMKNLISAE